MSNTIMVNKKVLEIDYLWDIDGLETEIVNCSKFFGAKGKDNMEYLIYAANLLKDLLIAEYKLSSNDLVFIYWQFVGKCIDYQKLKLTNPLDKEIAKKRCEDITEFLKVFGPIVKEDAEKEYA